MYMYMIILQHSPIKFIRKKLINISRYVGTDVPITGTYM